MRRIFVLSVLTVFFLFSPEVGANYDDNIYGDYLLAVNRKKISMDLEGASLIDVLKVFSQQTGLNFVSSEAVEDRKLTVYLESVPLKDAIDTIFITNNLSYEFYPDSNIFIVKDMGAPRIELETKVYYLKHARVKSSRLYQEIAGALERGEELGEGGGAGGGGGGGEDSADSGIIAAVNKVLSENGRVSEDARTNSLIITDVPSQFALIDKVVSSLDVPEPKVLIEVEILDVVKQNIDKMGIEWPNPEENEQLINLDLSSGSRLTRFPFGEGGTSGEGYTITTAAGTWPGGQFGPTMFSIIGTDLALNFLRVQKDTKILARPKILTLSGETAEIKLTANEVVGVTRSKDEESNTVEYEIEREETGTILRVTPRVNPRTGEITMLVEPTVAVALDTPYVFQDLVIRNVHYRKTKSVVSLKESQTLMIGGLIRSDNVGEKSKVPFFGDIPLIGALFRSEDKTIEERELLVFLTPRIISDSPTVLSKPVFLEGREQSLEARGNAIKNALAKFE